MLKIEELDLPTKFVGNDQTIRQMEPGGSNQVGAPIVCNSMNPNDDYIPEFCYFMEEIA